MTIEPDGNLHLFSVYIGSASVSEASTAMGSKSLNVFTDNVVHTEGTKFID